MTPDRSGSRRLGENASFNEHLTLLKPTRRGRRTSAERNLTGNGRDSVAKILDGVGCRDIFHADQELLCDVQAEIYIVFTGHAWCTIPA
jgi:hypothetical protein